LKSSKCKPGLDHLNHQSRLTPQKQNLLKFSECRVSSWEEFPVPCSLPSLFENSLLAVKKTVVEALLLWTVTEHPHWGNLWASERVWCCS